MYSQPLFFNASEQRSKHELKAQRYVCALGGGGGKEAVEGHQMTPPPTPSSLKFSTGVQFSCDSTCTFNNQLIVHVHILNYQRTSSKTRRDVNQKKTVLYIQFVFKLDFNDKINN